VFTFVKVRMIMHLQMPGWWCDIRGQKDDLGS
jgi:hypothetical protein